MKKIICSLAITIAIIGCEKDLYEDGIKQSSNITKTSQEYVSISEVPGLIPAIQNYNRAYIYLSSGSYSLPAGRSSEELDLDLENILKITSTDGKESYSINIKKAFNEYEDIFFENLHIYEKDGSFTSKILKYNQTDDSEKFDMNTFTGSVEMYDKERNLEGVFQYINGVQRCEKITIGCYHIWFFSTTGEIWLWNDCNSGGSGSVDSGSSGNDGGDGFSNGSNIGAGNYYGSGNGNYNGTIPNQNDPTLSEHIPIIPNNIWPEITSQIDKANRISTRLDLSTIERTWLRSPLNEMTDAVYTHMQPIQQNADIDFGSVKNGIQTLAIGGISFNPMLLDDQITSSLPPCLDNILNDIKSLQNGKFGKVITQFVGVNPIPTNYNWSLSTATIPSITPGDPPPAAVTGGANPSTTIINDHYLNTSTDLSFVRTMIHESFHAYLKCVYRYRNIDMSYVNLINQYAAQFNNDENDIHHHLFAQNNIIDHISKALMEYGNSHGYNLTQQYCDDMAWAGLIGTQAFRILPTSQQDRITSRLMAETFNNSNNPLGLSPVGHQACP